MEETPRVLDEECDVGVGGEFEKGCRAAEFGGLDEIFLIEAENVHGHLTGDQADIRLDASLA